MRGTDKPKLILSICLDTTGGMVVAFVAAREETYEKVWSKGKD